MTFTAALLVLLGGAVGAPARYLVDAWFKLRRPGAFPAGTLAVNVAGTLLLGFVGALVNRGGAPGWVSTLVGTGFCGALTTFSTFSVENVRLLEDGDRRTAASYLGASLVLGALAVLAGWQSGILLAG